MWRQQRAEPRAWEERERSSSLVPDALCGDRSGTETVVTGIRNPQGCFPGSIIDGLAGHL